MKYLFLLLLFCFSAPAIAAQADTTAYQTQRLKVNALLNERSARFSQYDQSLDARTGIFGMQTKDDIKNSNEILRQIVLTDNNVFKELKILMDYKDLELKKAQNNANTISGNLENYRSSIKKLQDQNQLLNEQLKGQHSSRSIAWYLAVILAIVLGITLYQYKKKFKART